MSVWAVNYGVASVLAIALYLFLEWKFEIPTAPLLVMVLTPVLLFNIAFARHAKAYFLALDHFCDPHEKEGGDDRGNKPTEPSPPVAPTPSPASPNAPKEPALH